MINTMSLLYPFSGFLVGLVVGLSGVGGGSLMTPLLVLLFGVHPATAVGTDLLYAAATKTVGTAVHNASSTVDWRIVRRLAAGSVPASAATMLVVSRLGANSPAVTHTITFVLGVALLVSSVAILFRRQLVDWAGRRFGAPSEARARQLTVASGVLLGVLVSLSSVGAGALGVVFLFLLYPGLPAARIVGSDIAHAVPLTLLAGLGHWWLGSVDWTLFGNLLVGSVPGILIGSYIGARVPDRGLRPILAGVLLLVGGRLVF